MKKLILAVFVMTASLVAQDTLTPASRTSAIGGHTVGKKSLVDDVSDIYSFPSEVAKTPDVAQGFATFAPTPSAVTFAKGTAFVVKSFSNNISAGLVFGQPSVLQTNDVAGDIQTGFVNSSANAWDFGALTLTPPLNSGHFLLGYKLGEIKLGLDLYREASNNSIEKDSIIHLTGANAGQTRNDKAEGFSKIGALGLNGGLELKLSSFAIKATAGYANLNCDMEYHTWGTNAGVALDDEKNIIETTSGLYIPAYAKATMNFGNHELSGMIDFSYTSYAFSAKHVLTTGAITATIEAKSDETSILSTNAGLLYVAKVGENTKIFSSFAVERKSKTVTPANGASDSITELTTVNTTLPRTSVGVEHTINKLWKFDQLIVRAGGFKTYSWETRFREGGNSTSIVSDAPDSQPFFWSTGVGFVMGKVTLDLSIRPDTWNGIYLISGQGPYGGNVTMTYNY